MKTLRRLSVASLAFLAACVVLAVVLTHLGHYKACGSDTSVDLNSARLRTRSFFLWFVVNEQIEDSEVSRVLATAGLRSDAQPRWKLTSARSWPGRVYPHFEFGKASVALTQAEILMSNPALPKTEKERICAAFLNNLTKADIQGLQELTRAEVMKLNTAKSP
jgi:hypothetical protein